MVPFTAWVAPKSSHRTRGAVVPVGASSRFVGNSTLGLLQGGPSSVILAIAGVFTPILAKHSKSFSLIDCISVGSTECSATSSRGEGNGVAEE